MFPEFKSQAMRGDVSANSAAFDSVPGTTVAQKQLWFISYVDVLLLLYSTYYTIRGS